MLGCFMARDAVLEEIKRLDSAWFPLYEYPEDAVRAAWNLTRVRALRDDDLGEPVRLPVRRDEAARLVADARAKGGGWLSSVDAFRLLEAYGIGAETRDRRRTRRREVAAAAEALGGPVAHQARRPRVPPQERPRRRGARRRGGRGRPRDGRAARGRRPRRLPRPAVAIPRPAHGPARDRAGARRAHRPRVRRAGRGRARRHLRRDPEGRPLRPRAADPGARPPDARPPEGLPDPRGGAAGRRASTSTRSSTPSSACRSWSRTTRSVVEIEMNPVMARADGVQAVDVRIRVSAS